ncbi:MAG: hypothetical protein M0P31_01505 [Solirubrobacteraceae bacterium]|nr:hypothetical protein [Solirubrobacteraceae bacterium]
MPTPPDARTVLRDALDGDPPDGLVTALDDDALRALAATVTDARRRQARALDDAERAALAHLPRVLRGAVERILR